MSLQQEIDKRRTFAIISHPDAGKTTLTEKFLLFGGAIKTAGAVKQNKIKKSATSDFMEIEKQRGISVATSVMGFTFKGKKVNILDTPGHKDFAEDTYRTLTAVDSVILVVDSVKGVEAQTERLMEVCRMRRTPVIIFVNKMDREGRSPVDILDELEKKLQINVRPLTWPISQGKSFQGVYSLYDHKLNLFKPEQTKITEHTVEITNIDDPELDRWIPGAFSMQLREDVELIEGVYEPFDLDLYLEGMLAPVFFGSAVNNFGIREMLETFLEIAPIPDERETDQRIVKASEEKMTGFVFKIHANLDPNHRDRTAFFRGFYDSLICFPFIRNRRNFKKGLKHLSDAEIIDSAAEKDRGEHSFEVKIEIKRFINAFYEFDILPKLHAERSRYPAIELRVIYVCDFNGVFGYFGLFRFEQVEFMIIEAVDSLKTFSLTDGPGERTNVYLQFLFKLIENIHRASSLTVHLVDKYDDRRTAHSADFHKSFGLCLDALDTVYDKNDTVYRSEGPVGVFGEVFVPRCVKDVDLFAFKCKTHNGGSYGDAALLLNLHKITGCGFFNFVLFDGSSGFDRSSKQQELLGQCCFSCIRMADNGKCSSLIYFLLKAHGSGRVWHYCAIIFKTPGCIFCRFKGKVQKGERYEAVKEKENGA